ncbi:proliferation-associated protein 2G4-like [Anneissia japonica]|uniref:proliferation-associated protein 2G4-like n=1 Tax=Anneissia japonica TaxID=1529436 RepID=UPI001425A967|nr:proliferation-associated protein 2G4-like [Anneissia japonica]
MADSGSSSGEDEENTIAADLVVTKYKLAAGMVNAVLKHVMEKCVEGAIVLELCKEADKLLLEKTGSVYKKDKEIKKGIAFPVCISVNNCICHYSPLESEAPLSLKTGDVVKIDLGAHVDGMIATVAHTLVVGSSLENKITGRKADVIKAAYYCSEAAQRMVKPGNKNSDVTSVVDKIAEAFKCKPVEGMLSHQLKKNVIDGEKSIIINPTDQQRKDHKECEFQVHDVYAVDVLVSTGEGKTREGDVKTSIYKVTGETYSLKSSTSRQLFAMFDKNMPTCLRQYEQGESKARLGVVECVTHNLLQPYPVLFEKPGEFVAQFKFTTLLMPNAPIRITNGDLKPEVYESEYSIQDEEIKAILSVSTSRKAAKKKKKKAASKAAEAAEDPEPPQLVQS